tara:strand:- start:1091 stop:1384 length:294 start_codon:yes stop_codon:yes gene_type:complete
MRLDSIENILDEYDFQRVKKAMEALDWQWGTAEDGVPSIAELRRQARGLLEDVYRYEDSTCITMGCGGFEANRLMEVGDLNKYLSLKFVVEEGNNYE